MKDLVYSTQKLISSNSKISRAQIYEVVSAAYGFKSYAALSASSVSVGDIAYFLSVSPKEAIKNRLKDLNVPDPTDKVLDDLTNLILPDWEDCYFDDTDDLREHLTSSPNDLVDNLEAEIENACSSYDGYFFDGAEVNDAVIETDTAGNLIVKIFMSASLSQVPERMLSTNDNYYELVATVKIPRLSLTGFGPFEVLSTDISGSNSFYNDIAGGE